MFFKKKKKKKRELWGIVLDVRMDCDYLIGTYVIIQKDGQLLIVGVILRIAYIKSLNIEVQHVARKDKSMVNMMSRTKYRGKGMGDKEQHFFP